MPMVEALSTSQQCQPMPQHRANQIAHESCSSQETLRRNFLIDLDWILGTFSKYRLCSISCKQILSFFVCFCTSMVLYVRFSLILCISTYFCLFLLNYFSKFVDGLLKVPNMGILLYEKLDVSENCLTFLRLYSQYALC